MHPPEARAEAMRLIAAGINDCEISRRMGIPRGTIRDWRHPRYVRKTPEQICPRCWRPARPIRFTAEDYCELLGLYLGDGCISPGARTERLRLALDAKYQGIIEDARRLLERSFPANPVGLVRAHGGTMYYVSVYSPHTCPVYFRSMGQARSTNDPSPSSPGRRVSWTRHPGRLSVAVSARTAASSSIGPTSTGPSRTST
jgi:Homeodomain-like domain